MNIKDEAFIQPLKLLQFKSGGLQGSYFRTSSTKVLSVYEIDSTKSMASRSLLSMKWTDLVKV